MKKIKTILCILCFCSINLRAQDKANDNLRLLIYPVLVDKDTIVLSDSASFFKKEFCLSLEIDTINYKAIKSVKGNKNAFSYNGKVYSKQQLFPLNKYKHVLEFKIARFIVETYLSTDVQTVSGEGNCLTERQKIFMFDTYKGVRKRKADPKLHLSRIEAFNGHDHFITMSLIDGQLKVK